MIVLFGGFDDSGSPLGDTWEWNGSTWTQMNPAQSPMARGAAKMQTDRLGRPVLFGGVQLLNVLGDTWTWDGTAKTWRQQLGAGPPPRELAGMGYDPHTQLVVVFGGLGSLKNLDDTWGWDGLSWSLLNPGGGGFETTAYPGFKVNFAMASGSLSVPVLMFGGDASSPTCLCDTWLWSSPVAAGSSLG
jgi:hypothetical protein